MFLFNFINGQQITLQRNTGRRLKTKTFFDWFKKSSPNISPSQTSPSSPTPTPPAASTASSPSSIVSAPGVANVTSIPSIPEYTIQKGDNLESILLNNLKFPSGSSPTEKLNVIYNLFQSAEGKEALESMGIKDVNVIKTGEEIDIDKLQKLLNNK